MSLFDVIRYPVSTPPSYEELASIPKSVFDKWANFAGLMCWPEYTESFRKQFEQPASLTSQINFRFNNGTDLDKRQMEVTIGYLKRMLLEHEE